MSMPVRSLNSWMCFSMNSDHGCFTMATRSFSPLRICQSKPAAAAGCSAGACVGSTAAAGAGA
jgi:hypothetical protein